MSKKIHLKTKLFFLLFFVLFLNITSFAWANTLYQASTHVSLKPQAITDVKPGGSFWVALHMDMDEGWHIYWKNPGDSGFPVHIEWSLPDGFNAGPINWPYPHKMDEAGLATYGYEDEAYLLIQIFTPEDFNPTSTYQFSAKVKWLACETVCVPGTGDVTFQIPITQPLDQNTLAKSVLKLPIRQAPWELQVEDLEDSFFITMTSIDGINRHLSNAHFFSDKPKVIDHAAEQHFVKSKKGYTLNIPKSDLLDEKVDVLSGILINPRGWDQGGLRKAWEVNLPVGIIDEAVLPHDVTTTVTALLFAFLGGLILNLMPCVLPVLSLKVFNLVQHAKESRMKVLAHGLMFTLGIVSAFWVLALVMIGLRYLGNQVGWGFQFQSPIFLGVMAGLFLWLALSMFGLFEIGLGLTQVQGSAKDQGTLKGSFLNGVLATIVATPCTAPFMGSALGYAILQPVVISLLIFTFLGLGMAAPYVILSLFPGALKFVPKPGPWMVRFKQFLGVLLLATSIWLISVLIVQLKGAPAHQSSLIKWQEFSPTLVAQLKEEGKPIFIDFTASWCLTCQVNKKTSLNNKSVAGAFKDKGVVAVRADWTNYNEEITKALAEFGKTSIPVYVLYPADQSNEPILLPELLTPNIVLEYLDNINKGESK